MDYTTEDPSKHKENMKEKVRVVRLEDNTITKPNVDIGHNSAVSVWSLCDIHNDDTHVDLGDITPSISPVFTDEQVLELTDHDHEMVDPMTHRLLEDGDSIFSVDHMEQSITQADRKSNPLQDFHPDLEIFNREMQNLENLHGGRQVHERDDHVSMQENRDENVSKRTDANDGDIGLQSIPDKGKPSSPTTRRRSPRKQPGTGDQPASSPEITAMSLRTRNKPTLGKDGNFGKKKTGTTAAHATTVVSPEIEKKTEVEGVKKGPSRRSSRIAKHTEKELHRDTKERDENREKEKEEKVSGADHKAEPLPVSDNQAEPLAGEIKAKDKDENVIKTESKLKVPVQKPVPEKANISQDSVVQNQDSRVSTQKHASESSETVGKEKGKKPQENTKKKALSPAVPKVLPNSPEKRVTRSTTGNLKPKQTFDEIQEKLEIEKLKRLKKKAEEAEKLNTHEKKIEENESVESNKKDAMGDDVKDNTEKNDIVSAQDKTDAQNTESARTKSKLGEAQSVNVKKKTKKTKSKKGKNELKEKATESGDGRKVKSSGESSGVQDSGESEPESSEGEVDCHADDSDYSPEDDPDRLWCICRKPHGNRFMICCDGCEEWFHGKCVGITMEQGRIMEKNGREYVCDKCKEKKAKALLLEEKEKEKAKAKEQAEAHRAAVKQTIVREIYKHTRHGQKVEKEVSVPTPGPIPHQKPTSTVSSSSESDEKKRKSKEPGGFKIPKKVRTTPTPASHSHRPPTQKCIVPGCGRSAFEGAVYCGRTCIERHVGHAIKLLTAKEHGKTHTSEGNRVAVIEKFSGRVIAGMAAPVMNHLTEWMLKNPSFQVLIPGTSPTSHSSSSFYNKPPPETKVKKEVDRKNEEETVRSNVRRMMKEILITRKKESSDIRISVEEIMKLVSTIEEGMHKAFKDTSHRYKAKYRTLMFNLKDPRNKVLYRRVLTGDIPPDKLIWMTSDELATKELAQWREQETKHMIDMIKKEEENTNKARLIKKTHKGEVDVDEDEDFSTLESSNVKEESEEKRKLEKEEKSELPLLDTTDEHRAHLFDLNCKICTGKMVPPGEVVAMSPASVSNVPIQAAAESSIPSPPRDVTFTDPPSPDSNDFATTSSVPKVPSKTKEKPVWKGFVMMQSVAKFGTNAYLVSGSADNLIQILPDTLHVHGRIAHEQVWDYVFQCRTSTSREMCLIRFAAATDEEKMSYVSLYSYFHSRKRCGVIGNCYSGVKDMYLIPLASHQPVPPELMPFKGPGLPEPRPHMLLGLIIRTKPAGKRPRSISDRHLSTSPRATGEPAAKRSSVSESDFSKSSTQTSTTPKSTTPKSTTFKIKTPSKSTTPTLPDSPVDEIEDIVFHFHNTQAKLDSEALKVQQPSSTQPIPPVVTTLLKIQEQEKKLRALQEESERLEKDLASMKPTMPPAPSHPSLNPGVSAVLERVSGSVPAEKTASQQEASKVTSTAVEPANLYDPETAYDEETPYDPEDLDLCLEDEETSEKKPERTLAATKASDVSDIKPSTQGSLPEIKGGLASLLPEIARSLLPAGKQAVPPIVKQDELQPPRPDPVQAVKQDIVPQAERQAVLPPVGHDVQHAVKQTGPQAVKDAVPQAAKEAVLQAAKEVVPQTVKEVVPQAVKKDVLLAVQQDLPNAGKPNITQTLSQDVPHAPVDERVRPGPTVASSAENVDRSAPRSVPERPFGNDEYQRRSLSQGTGNSEGHSRIDVSQDPRRSRHRHAPGPDTTYRDFNNTRDHREHRRDSDESRRDPEESRFYSSRSRLNERRWSDDSRRGRYDGYRQRDERPRDDRQREDRHRDDGQWGFVSRNRGYGRDRYTRDRWRR